MAKLPKRKRGQAIEQQAYRLESRSNQMFPRRTSIPQRRHPPREHIEWCRSVFELLIEGGTWGTPRSGLVFQRRGNTLVLIDRMIPNPEMVPVRHHNDLIRYQAADFAEIKGHFEAAGIPVRDETTH